MFRSLGQKKRSFKRKGGKVLILQREAIKWPPIAKLIMVISLHWVVDESLIIFCFSEHLLFIR